MVKFMQKTLKKKISWCRQFNGVFCFVVSFIRFDISKWNVSRLIFERQMNFVTLCIDGIHTVCECVCMWRNVKITGERVSCQSQYSPEGFCNWWCVRRFLLFSGIEQSFVYVERDKTQKIIAPDFSWTLNDYCLGE